MIGRAIIPHYPKATFWIRTGMEFWNEYPTCQGNKLTPSTPTLVRRRAGKFNSIFFGHERTEFLRKVTRSGVQRDLVVKRGCLSGSQQDFNQQTIHQNVKSTIIISPGRCLSYFLAGNLSKKACLMNYGEAYLTDRVRGTKAVGSRLPCARWPWTGSNEKSMDIWIKPMLTSHSGLDLYQRSTFHTEALFPR